MSKIKALVMDVDGTLTDGSIYIGNDGEVMKCFYVRDGFAIKHILPKYGIIPIIITGRKSEIVEVRCRELNIRHLVQNSCNKMADLNDLLSSLGIRLEEAAYIGDDENDLDCMKNVGISACPADAVESIKRISKYITASNGGRGAVREFIEWLIDKNEKNISFKRNNK